MVWGGKKPATPPRAEAYIPTEADIREACRQYQSEWTAKQERERRSWTVRRLEVVRGRLR
jgi:hypothetical protein